MSLTRTRFKMTAALGGAASAVMSVLLCGAAHAVEIKALSVAGRDAVKADYFELSANDLAGGMVPVQGVLDTAQGVAKVAYSLDGGGAWTDATGVESFRFSFEPQEGAEYALVVRAVDGTGKAVASRVAVIRYSSQDLRQVFDALLENIRTAYVNERLQDFLAFFDEKEYPNFDTFRQRMLDTFDKTTNFNLNISIRQVELRVDKDLVVVRVDWDKSFETSSRQSGRSNEIHFMKKNGGWKITFIKDEAIFVIGTGTLRATA